MWWTTSTTGTSFSPSTPVSPSPCYCHSINAPLPSSFRSTCCWYLLNKGAKPGYLPKWNALSEIVERGLNITLRHFIFSYKPTVVRQPAGQILCHITTVDRNFSLLWNVQSKSWPPNNRPSPQSVSKEIFCSFSWNAWPWKWRQCDRPKRRKYSPNKTDWCCIKTCIIDAVVCCCSFPCFMPTVMNIWSYTTTTPTRPCGTHTYHFTFALFSIKKKRNLLNFRPSASHFGDWRLR